MSNDLITYSASVPDFLKEAGGYRDEGMAAGIAPKAPKLSMTTAKQWTITDEAGNTAMIQTQVSDDKGNKHVIPAPSVKGVIIASSGTLTKAWYEKAYVPGTNAAPDCFSNDGKVPAPGVAKPQCTNCAQCPKNAFGSHPVTGRGKACGDRKMIVLALDTMPDKFATFNVPTMSLASLREIDGKLKTNNIPLQSVMMEFTFDPGVTYPVAKIGAIGFIGKEHFEKFRDLADTDEVRNLLREVDYDVPAAEAQPVVPNNQIAFGTGGQVTQPVVETPKEPVMTEKEKKIAEAKAALAALEEEGEADEPQTQQTQTADVLGGSQANTTATAAAGAQTPARRKRRTQAEMEAERAQKAAAAAGVAQTGNALEQGVSTVIANDLTQAVQREEASAEQAAPTPAATGGAPNVLDLLSKWATKS